MLIMSVVFIIARAKDWPNLFYTDFFEQEMVKTSNRHKSCKLVYNTKQTNKQTSNNDKYINILYTPTPNMKIR